MSAPPAHKMLTPARSRTAAAPAKAASLPRPAGLPDVPPGHELVRSLYRWDAHPEAARLVKEMLPWLVRDLGLPTSTSVQWCRRLAAAERGMMHFGPVAWKTISMPPEAGGCVCASQPGTIWLRVDARQDAPGLVELLSHEARHAYQFARGKARGMSRAAMEADADAYAAGVLRWWHQHREGGAS